MGNSDRETLYLDVRRTRMGLEESTAAVNNQLLGVTTWKRGDKEIDENREEKVGEVSIS